MQAVVFPREPGVQMKMSEPSPETPVTVNDPTVWTRSWTAMIPLQRTDDPIHEYACHEGNYRSMEGSLKGMRIVEQEATRTGTTRQ